MSKIRLDDNEPIYQHQVERDAATKPRTEVCTDEKCDIKMQPHSHKSRLSKADQIIEDAHRNGAPRRNRLLGALYGDGTGSISFGFEQIVLDGERDAFNED